jgi:hypothetical protein
MAMACVSVGVDVGTPLRARPFCSVSGGSVAWLDLGDGGEVGVSGSPAAMRRLAAALLATATAAERRADAGLMVVARCDGDR